MSPIGWVIDVADPVDLIRSGKDPEINLIEKGLTLTPTQTRLARAMKLVQLDTFSERIRWTYRSWKWGYPLPPDPDEWDENGTEDPETRGRKARAILRAWKFLAPFFASRGYFLSEADPNSKDILALYPPPIALKSSDVRDPYPYARRHFNDDREISFAFISNRVFPARDGAGRDVVIRLASGATPSDELKIFQRLNTKETRSDPRNHTLPVLDFLPFDGLVFVVMPRWSSAFSPDFANVRELLHCAEVFLEGMDFLHEHRIAHRDFLVQNTMINAITSREWQIKGLRNPEEVRYAIIDFGASVIFPYDTDIEVFQMQRAIHSVTLSAGLPEGQGNPFKDDVAYLGVSLQRWVRHIEKLVPDIGKFFDDMLQEDEKLRPNCRQALQNLRNIQSRLTREQLDQEIFGRYWKKGKVLTKAKAAGGNNSSTTDAPAIIP